MICTDTWYSMDESRKQQENKGILVTKCHIMCDSIYNLSRMDKPIETEKRWGKMEMIGGGISLWGENVLKLNCNDDCTPGECVF